jgi:hypothetical protein
MIERLRLKGYLYIYRAEGVQMSYSGIPCGFCGAMKVTYSYAPNGFVIYKCEECLEKWKDE